jgi:exonuclease SbcC
MLPLYLSLEGLYSYQQKQEIDFTALTEAGLFGIFGAVGSGKSSILEAIGYALYGETERLNSKEKRAYNMMNLKSNNVVIDFQFLNFEGRKFRFIARWRRRKNFQDITDNTRDAYEWIDGNWVPLQSNDGTLLTNLSYSNFRRTIIIPQGQFKEFLELKGKDRSEMMKEIFFLNQYDLGPKTSIMLSHTNKKIENLKGALSGFEEVNDEVLQEKNSQFQELETTLIQLKKEFEQLDIQYKSLQTAKQNRQDLAEKLEELDLLEAKKSAIQKVEKEINEFELVSTNFREHLNNFDNITSNKKTLLTKIERLKESKDTIKATLNVIEETLELLKPQFDNLDNKKAEIQDLNKLIQNLASKQAKNEKEAGMIKGKRFLAEQQHVEEQLTKAVLLHEQEIDRIKSSRINSADLLTIDAWYQKNEQITKDLEEENQRVHNLQEQIQELKSKFSELGYNESTWDNELENKLSELIDKESQLQIRESDIRLKQELSQYIHKLHDGEPCPLCGSEEHPLPMHIQVVDEEFSILELEKNSLQVEKEKLHKIKSELQLVNRIIADRHLELQTYQLEISNIENKWHVHQNNFSWTDFNKDNRAVFESKKIEVFKIEEQLTQLDIELKSKRDQLKITKDTIQNAENKLSKYQSEINVLEASIIQNLQQIQVIEVNQFVDFDQFSLEDLVNKNIAQIVKINEEYQDFNKKLLEQRTQYAQIKGAYSEAQEQYTLYTSQLKEIQNFLHKLLVDFNYPDIATVKVLLDKNLNISESRKTINDFYVAYSTLQNRIIELKNRADEDNYSDEIFNQLTDLITLKKKELEVQIGLYGALKEDLERITTELSKKQELLLAYQKLQARKDNLKILDNMFKGNGFVNYVSSIHLHRLCEIANQRFHRLTKNQLSLVINEANEFEIIDYLNDGRRRSAKTLSGGQAFQASLCLALALAENIQSLNKADKNFFFIDEGFGTQDSESINTVFDTLQYLHQENRVVGIISHVDELKERMPRSITVVKDIEKGSQVIIN